MPLRNCRIGRTGFAARVFGAVLRTVVWRRLYHSVDLHDPQPDASAARIVERVQFGRKKSMPQKSRLNELTRPVQSNSVHHARA
jgi:hypothetical protein